MGFFRDLKDNLNETANDFDKNNVENNKIVHTLDSEYVGESSTEPELAKLAASLAKEAELSLDKEYSNNFNSNDKIKSDKINHLSVDNVLTDNSFVLNPSKEESEFTEQSVLPGSDENIENTILPQEHVSIIAKELSIKGELNSQGSIELYGCVVGNITCIGKLTVSGKLIGDVKAKEMFAENAHIQGNIESTGPIKIGHKTIIVGNISATSAVIAGAVKGDVDVHGPVIIDSTAVVLGNIKSESVQVNNGATINGCCSQCYADFKPTDIFDDFIENNK